MLADPIRLTSPTAGCTRLSDVSLDVGAGQFVAVVGPNGAGKTTLFKAISGTVAPVAGAITYRAQDLLAVPPGERAHLGIAHVPEGRQVFASMTVMENLEMGAYTRSGRARWQRAISTVILALSRCSPSAATSSPGRCPAASSRCSRSAAGSPRRPKLLMLDEPSMGLAPTVVDTIFERIHQIHREHGITDPAGRAARGRGARVLRPRLRAGDRAGRRCEGHARQLMADDRVDAPISGCKAEGKESHVSEA